MTNAAHASASKIAQLLGEVIVHHAPWTAEITEDAKRRRVEALLEELEDHTADIMGPLLGTIKATGAVPPALQVLFDSVANPEHQVSALAGQFLVFGVGFAVAEQVLAPFLQDIANALWSDNTTKPLDPANLAVMAVRGIDPNTTSITPVSETITAIAAESGLSPQYMQALVDSIGNPPSPQDLFTMFRRGIIAESDVELGLREGDTRDEWIARYVKLAYSTPSPIDLVRAAVQSQLTYEQANAIAIQLGLEPPGYVANNIDWFQLLFDIAGRPPGPEEAGRMANRGIIPWTGTGATALTFQQAVAESDIKTKWTDALQALQAYVPPPRMVGGLLKSGSITADQAKSYWEMGGVPSDLAAAYVHQATIEETIQEKDLAKGDVLKGLYEGIISQPDATELLGLLGFTGQTATYMIELTLMRREFAAINKAVNSVGSLYTHYKLTEADAKTSLTALDVPDAQITELLNIWSIQRTPEVRLPTVHELAAAVHYSGFPFADAVTGAMRLGYTEYDATVIIAGAAEVVPPNGYPPNTDTGVQV